jgi:hypothetical protein
MTGEFYIDRQPEEDEADIALRKGIISYAQSLRDRLSFVSGPIGDLLSQVELPTEKQYLLASSPDAVVPFDHSRIMLVPPKGDKTIEEIERIFLRLPVLHLDTNDSPDLPQKVFPEDVFVEMIATNGSHSRYLINPSEISPYYDQDDVTLHPTFEIDIINGTTLSTVKQPGEGDTESLEAMWNAGNEVLIMPEHVAKASTSFETLLLIDRLVRSYIPVPHDNRRADAA